MTPHLSPKPKPERVPNPHIRSQQKTTAERSAHLARPSRMSLTVDRQDDVDGLGGLVRQTGVASKGKREKLKKKRKAAEPVSNSKCASRLPPHEFEAQKPTSLPSQTKHLVVAKGSTRLVRSNPSTFPCK